MSTRPIAACSVRYHAQELALAAHALCLAEPGSTTFDHHADGARNRFAKLCAAFAALEAAIAPVLTDADFEPTENDGRFDARSELGAGLRYGLGS